jgi:hypothetical protein
MGDPVCTYLIILVNVYPYNYTTSNYPLKKREMKGAIVFQLLIMNLQLC